MTDINQVRINELARELEVKAKAIIDLLPGFGVTEKKTHSSSIPADVAVKVRATIQGQAQVEADAEARAKSDKES
ncbi:MAG TPA: translation initiation factor IF-2 N-terminal domain-containing protein, partial [Candidatus Angelobacter sp.]|nr:translation initiation factor IF-2 N-terminal domain-containing protein [Candidatus Angelobacter sp.]